MYCKIKSNSKNVTRPGISNDVPAIVEPNSALCGDVVLLRDDATVGGKPMCVMCVYSKIILLQIPNQLHFFTKIGDFLDARCKKSLLDVKNLPVDSRRN